MSKKIKNRIDKLNSEAERLIAVETFTLNSKVAAIMAEINELQNKCEHHFVDGICEFCYTEEC
jgi:hypothetical protein